MSSPYNIQSSRSSSDSYINRYSFSNPQSRNHSRANSSENPFANIHDENPLSEYEVRPKPISKKSLITISVAVALVWLIALITYSKVPHTNIEDYKDYNVSKAFGLNSSSPTTQASQITASSLSPLPSAASDSKSTSKLSLGQYRSGKFFVMDKSFNFIAPPSGSASSDDEGLYFGRDSNGYSAKKLSDSSFDYHLIGRQFSYNGSYHSIDNVAPSYDLKYLLISSSQEVQWRHSHFSEDYIYDIAAKDFTPLHTVNGTVARISYSQWSPKYNYISFVYENNVYVYDMATKQSSQVTFDGGKDIFNGKPDWVYEEEVVASDRLLWWSPNEKNFVFIKTNDTNVPVYEIDYYTKNTESKYPTHSPIKYPKPGYANPELQVINYNVADNTTRLISHDDEDGKQLGKEFIVYDVFWLNDNDFIVKETDRESNLLHYRFYDHNLGSSNVFKSVDAAKDFGGWIDKSKVVVIPKNEALGRNADGYVELVTDKNGFEHIGYFESKSIAPKKVFTAGDFDVKANFMTFDYQKNILYFTSTKQSSMSSHLYSIELKLDEDVEAVALTDDSQLAFFEPSFSPSAKYLNLIYQGPRMPTQQIVDLHSSKNSKYFSDVKSILNTKHVETAHEEIEVPTKQYMEIEVDPKTNLKVNVIETKPRNFDPTKKYPLLVNFYGGPGSQRTEAKYGVGFSEVVASSLDCIVLLIDPRGTDSKGWSFKKWARNKMGYWEPRDIIAATKKYVEDNQYIDSERTAAWGWSYSGFVTLKLLETDENNLFKYGAAVAPVTDWRLYDSIYTERYIGTPESDPEGYRYATVGASDDFKFNNFKEKKRFLIMHGTGDDNVHIQNTFTLLDKLNLANVENFDMKIFPDSDHSIYYHNANTIVYDKLFNWLKDAFNGNLEKLNG